MATNKSTIKFKGKSPIMKELQKLISFRAYEDVFASGKSDKATALYLKCHELYHGKSDDGDSMGYAEQFVNGVPMFAPIFDKDVNQQEGTAVLAMKEIFHCLPNVRIIVSSKKRMKVSTWLF